MSKALKLLQSCKKKIAKLFSHLNLYYTKKKKRKIALFYNAEMQQSVMFLVCL